MDIYDAQRLVDQVGTVDVACDVEEIGNVANGMGGEGRHVAVFVLI